MLKKIQVIFLIGVQLLLGSHALANTSEQWLSQEIRVEDGLPDATVYSLAQDQSGLIWFGTTNGVASYDGYDFAYFKHDGMDANTISNNNAGNIFIDSHNILWIGTFGGGVNTLDLNTGKLTRYPYSSQNLDTTISENVQTFYEDKNGNIWVGTSTGLYKISADKISHFSHQDDNPNSLLHSRVWDIVGDKYAGIWIATSAGLSHLEIKTSRINNYLLPEELSLNIASNQFRRLLILDDTIWIGSSTGLYSFNINSKTFIHHTPSLDIKINDITLMENQQLLLASMDGLYQFDLSSQTFRLNESGEYWQRFEKTDIRNIMFDSSGLLWLATRDNGVIKINTFGGLFEYDNQFTSTSEQIWSLEYDAIGNLYMGTSASLYRKNTDNTFDKISSKDSDDIPGIIRDTKVSRNNGLWIASSAGLYFLENGSLLAEQISQPFDLVDIAPTDVFSIEETSTGEIWMALYNVGILRWQPKQATAQLIQSYSGSNLTDINLVHVYADTAGDIWIGSNLVGLFRFKQATQELELFTNDYNDINSPFIQSD